MKSIHNILIGSAAMSLICAFFLLTAGETGWIPALLCSVVAVLFHSQQVSTILPVTSSPSSWKLRNRER